MAVSVTTGGLSTTSLGTPLSSSRRSLASHRFSVVQGKSNRVLQEEPNCYSIESLGVAVPLEFKALLKHCHNIHLDPSGWAVGMTGSKLLAWAVAGPVSHKVSKCVTLSVPSGPAWSVDLVAVYPGESSLGMVCVSESGDVMFWPQFTSDQYCVVQGEIDIARKDSVKCVCVVPGGFLVGTTHCNLYILTHDKMGLLVHPIDSKEGMLSYVSRRVSSLFFRPSDQQKLLQAFSCTSGDGHVILLYESLIEKRIVLNFESKILFECDTCAPLREAVAAVMGSEEETSLVSDGLLWQVGGVCQCADRLVFLVAAISPLGDDAVQLYVVVAKQPGTDGESKVSLHVENVVDISVTITEEGQLSELVKHYTLVNTSSITQVAVVGPQTIHLCEVTPNCPSHSLVDISQYSPLAATGCVNGQCVLLSESCGLMTFIPTPVTMDTSQTRHQLVTAVDAARTPKASFFGTPLQAKYNTKETETVKKSFSLYCEQKLASAVEVCQKANLYDAFTHKCGSHGDNTVVQLSEAIIDEFPAADPRWAETTSVQGASGRSSVIIQYQLEDKQFAHAKYLEYLKEVNMMDRVCSVMRRRSPLKTLVVLCEHGEKLNAALALKDIHSKLTPLKKQGPTVVDLCIKKVLDFRKISTKNTKLTDQDLFYREVSTIDDIFWAMRDYLNEQWELLGDQTSQQWLLYGTTSVVKGMLAGALTYREQHLQLFADGPPGVGVGNVWTFTSSPKGVRCAVYDILGKVFSETPPEGDINQQLWKLVAEITDLVLSEYVQLLPKLQDPHERSNLGEEFERERTLWIQPFVGHQLQMASELAEKYRDFRTLVEVCDITQSREQLDKFVEQYHDQGFHEVLYSYYVEKGKYSLLFDQPVEHKDLFTAYLRSLDNPNLLWVNGINIKDFETSTVALETLTRKENVLPKKKTLLSLTKLCRLLSKDCSEKTEMTDAVNRELKYISFQENIPPGLLRANDVDPENRRVLTCEEMVNYYTENYCDVSAEENLQHFMCALDLANLRSQVDPDEGHQLKLFVWLRAILRDSDKWPTLSPEDPIKSLQSTFFFQLVEAIFNELVSQQQVVMAARANLSHIYLVDLKELMSARDIAHLKLDSNFEFLIKAGYEHVTSNLPDLPQ